MTMPEIAYHVKHRLADGLFLTPPSYIPSGENYTVTPYIRADIAEELARAALQVIDNYGFTGDGNDGYREVDTDHITELENALARYRQALDTNTPS